MGSRRRFTKELKQEVVQQLETHSSAEICREHNIHPNILYRWKREYEANPEEAFRGNGKLLKDDVKIVHYERLIGQLCAENDLLKKSILHLRKLQAEELRKRCSTK